MPRASPEYCKNTPITKMGFTQRSSCKAQGLIPRTSKTQRGRYIISPKYSKKRKTPNKKSRKVSRKISRKYGMISPKKSKKSIKRVNTSLYSSGKGKPRVKTGFANEEKARMTLRNIKEFDMVYQKQVVNTMYNRAKYHPNQTVEMRKAMRIFKEWLKKNL